MSMVAGMAVAVSSGPRHPPSLAVAHLDSHPLKWHPVLTEEQGFGQQIAAFLDFPLPAYKILKARLSNPHALIVNIPTTSEI
jgi:hypothetical protein